MEPVIPKVRGLIRLGGKSLGQLRCVKFELLALARACRGVLYGAVVESDVNWEPVLLRSFGVTRGLATLACTQDLKVHLGLDNWNRRSFNKFEVLDEVPLAQLLSEAVHLVDHDLPV